MQVSVETTGSLGRRMKVALPADRIEQEFTERLKRLARQVRLPGFRPGKAPMKIVEAQYGNKLMEEIAGELIQSTFQEAIGQQGLKPAGGPRFQPPSMERGKQFEYVAEFEVYPEISKIDLTGRKIERITCTLTAEDVDRTIETLRKQHITWRPVERAAQKGDRLMIDFRGTLAGKVIEGGAAANFPLVLGSGTLVTTLEEGLVGATGGEKRTVKVPFPSDYHAKELCGKTADFEVTVNEVAESELPEVSDDFARLFGVKDGSMETLRAEIMSNLQREKDQRVRSLVKQRVLDALTAENAFEVPAALVQEEIERMKKQNPGQPATGAQEGQSAYDGLYASAAENRVKLGLILAEVIRANNITIDPAQVRTRIEEMATEYEAPEEFIRWHYDNPAKLQDIQLLLVEEAAVNALLQSAEVTDQPMSFQELVKAK